MARARICIYMYIIYACICAHACARVRICIYIIIIHILYIAIDIYIHAADPTPENRPGPADTNVYHIEFLMRRLQHHRAVGVSLGHGKMSQTRHLGHRNKNGEVCASGTWYMTRNSVLSRMYKRVQLTAGWNSTFSTA